MFAFGTDFVGGWLVVSLPQWRGFRGEDYSFFARCGWGILWGWGFDAQAEEHCAAAEVGLGGVVEDVLFAEAGLGDGAEFFYFAQDCGDAGDAEFDFDFSVGLFSLGHGDSIGRLLPKLMA